MKINNSYLDKNTLIFLKKNNKFDSIKFYSKIDTKNIIENIFDGFGFDLDGTLFNDSGIIEKQVLSKLILLLKKGVPIVFITGRGPKTTDKIIFNNYLMDYSDIYVSNYNGGLIRKIKKGSNYIEVLKENIITNNAVFNLIKGNKEFSKKLVYNNDNNNFYSKNGKYQIRLVFKKDFFDKEGNLDKLLILEIEKILKNNEIFNLDVLYTGNTIDLVSKDSGKENSVKFIENLLNKKLARVGDRGGQYGNDFSMLSYGKGFTVLEGNTANPVLNNNGIQIYKQEAINRLLDIIKFS